MVTVMMKENISFENRSEFSPANVEEPQDINSSGTLMQC